LTPKLILEKLQLLKFLPFLSNVALAVSSAIGAAFFRTAFTVRAAAESIYSAY